jgi:hypothetical protein
MNRFCDKCIAEKVVAGLVKPMYEYYGAVELDHWCNRKPGKCDLCGEKNILSLYPPMEKFYKQKVLLDKYRSVTTISAKELAELQKQCNELDIPIGKIAPDMMKKVAIDDKNAKSQLMKHLTFDEWFNKKSIIHNCSNRQHDLMREAWDAAVKNNPAKIEYIDRTKNEINELQGIIDGALQIQCTCDQAQIKKGYRCGCGKQETVKKAVMDLTFYLKELKK